MTSINNLLHTSALAVLLSVSLLATPTRAAAPEAVVELATVTEGASSSVIKLPGTVISTSDAAIAAELSGRLTWVAQVGERIAKGQPVATIDDHLLQLQLRNNEAQLARLDADISYNRRQIVRLQRLTAQNNLAESELDLLQSQLEMLLQERRIAEVDRDRSRYDLARCQVTAPFTGIIASRSMNLGEYTAPGSQLVRLVDTQALEVSVSAPLRVARHNHAGDAVQVASGDHHAMAAIRGVVPVGDPRSRMMELRLALPDSPWLIGEAVTVELPDGDNQSALNVPRDALVLRNDQVFVYTVGPDNTAVKVPVTTLAGRGSLIAIAGDLKSGDAVVVRGAERLQPGQALKVIQHHLATNK